jgi:hypothetical protein
MLTPPAELLPLIVELRRHVIEGIRYVHHAFDYPREEGWSKEPLKQICESASQAEADRRRKEM